MRKRIIFFKKQNQLLTDWVTSRNHKGLCTKQAPTTWDREAAQNLIYKH